MANHNFGTLQARLVADAKRITKNTLYKKDRVEEIPASIQKIRTFDIERTNPLLTENSTEQEMGLLSFFPSKMKEGMILCIQRL